VVVRFAGGIEALTSTCFLVLANPLSNFDLKHQNTQVLKCAT